MRGFIAGAWIGIWVLACFAVAAPAADADCPVITFHFHYKHGVVTFEEHGETTAVRVEVADTRTSREFGLMCRPSLAPDAGMLFRFSHNTATPFWMKNTLIPLSIAFIDKSWRIVGLMNMPVAPDPSSARLPTYGPDTPYRYALEVNEGFFARHAIDTAAQVTFTPANP